MPGITLQTKFLWSQIHLPFQMTCAHSEFKEHSLLLAYFLNDAETGCLITNNETGGDSNEEKFKFFFAVEVQHFFVYDFWLENSKNPHIISRKTIFLRQ